MKDIKVHPMTVRGDEYEVWVQPGGKFVADFDGEPQRADTYEGLYKRMMTKTKVASQAVSIAFTAYRQATWRDKLMDGVIVRFHSIRGTPIVSWGDGTPPKEFSEHHYAIMMRPLDESEKATFLRLQAELHDANEALNAFKKPRRLDLAKLREDAEAAAAADATEEVANG